MLRLGPGWVLRTGAAGVMATVRADEERGWTRRGREPCWTRSVADSTCWVGQWRDHDDAVAVSSGLEDQVDGAGRRLAEETSQALEDGPVSGSLPGVR
jgi:hypothetical protein